MKILRPVAGFLPTYGYFSNYCDSFEGRILDYGSNCGNLLKSGPLNPANYTGVDVDEFALYVGKVRFPKAQWLHHNRWHPCYNPDGDDSFVDLPEVDLAFSYSVFSHFWFEEFIHTLQRIKAKQIYLSYCDIKNSKCVEWFREQLTDPEEIPTDEKFIYLVDNYVSREVPNKCAKFTSFWNTEYLVHLLGRFGKVEAFPPPERWYQSCIRINTA